MQMIAGKRTAEKWGGEVMEMADTVCKKSFNTICQIIKIPTTNGIYIFKIFLTTTAWLLFYLFIYLSLPA